MAKTSSVEKNNRRAKMAKQYAAKRAKLDAKPRVSYIEKEPGKFEKLLESLGSALAPNIAASVRAQLGFQVADQGALALQALAGLLQQVAQVQQVGQAALALRAFR